MGINGKLNGHGKPPMLACRSAHKCSESFSSLVPSHTDPNQPIATPKMATHAMEGLSNPHTLIPIEECACGACVRGCACSVWISLCWWSCRDLTKSHSLFIYITNEWTCRVYTRTLGHMALNPTSVPPLAYMYNDAPHNSYTQIFVLDSSLS